MRTLYKKYRTVALLLLAYALPVLTRDPYVLHLANMACIFAILTLSLNILTGFTGQFSVGHAAFYGIGAYTSSLLAVKAGAPVWLGFLAAPVVAAIFGILLGLPTLRLRGFYLGVVTLGFGEIMYQVFVNWISLTNGPKGLTGVPAPRIGSIVLDTYGSYYFLSITLLVLTIVIAYRLLYSRVGRALMAIRENETAAEATGINSTYYKVMAFCISASLAGMAGALYAHEIMFVSPESFVNAESVSILSMMVVGGIGSIPGSVVGAITLTLVPEYLRSFGDLRLVVYGLAIVLMVIYSPQGIGGWITRVDQYLSGTAIRKPVRGGVERGAA
ncbi:MAG: branched-chain amino acid ABC transporter permease [Bacillota bacterium]